MLKEAIQTLFAGQHAEIAGGRALVHSNQTDISDLERFQDQPNRIRTGAVMTDTTSFLAFVDRFKSEDSVCFASADDSRVDFIGDYPNNGKPLWAGNRGAFEASCTDAFRAWQGLNNQLLPQKRFAEFMRENSVDMVEPDAATMETIARSLEVKRSVDFKSASNLVGGNVQLSYEETDKARAKGNIDIPESFTIGLQIYEGGDRYQIKCFLRYTMKDGELKIGFAMHRLSQVERQAFDDLIEGIKAHVDFPIFMGS